MHYQIGVILHRVWDPIGVRDEPLVSNEYGAYVGSVYRLLASGGSAPQVAALLASIEAEQMGLDSGDPERLIPVAEELLRLDIRLGPPGTPDAPGRDS